MTRLTLDQTTTRHRSAGFTLIEITVAVIIMAILAIISYRGLSALLDARDHLTMQTRRWYNLSVFFSQLENDLSQLRERKVRGRNGSFLPPFIGKPDFVFTDPKTDEDAQLIFTRAGIPDQVGFAADMKRVGYRYRDGKIEVLLWPVLDLAPDTYPKVETVLENVRSMTFQYWSNRKVWVARWPDNQDRSATPRGIEVIVELSSGEKIRRVIALQQGVTF